jgi:AcrR family transcriptional regulator
MTANDRTARSRDRILAAACAVIAEVGFEKVRMRLVAQRAGVSSGLLHYHFESRERLFAAALRYSYEHTGAASYAAAEADERSATDRLALAIDACLPLTEELRQDQLLWHELWLRAARDEESRLLALEFYRMLHDWFAGTIRTGIDAGEFRNCQVEEVTVLTLLLLDGIAIRLSLEDPSFPPSQARARVWEQLSPHLGLPARMPAARTAPLPPAAATPEPATASAPGPAPDSEPGPAPALAVPSPTAS